jgi:uncharacterized protein (TIGR00369 family)
MDAPQPDFADAVRTAVLTLPAAAHLGFTFTALTPGAAELILAVRPEHRQHAGAVAGGVLGALADFAGGSAAGTLLPAGWATVTADYTVKLLSPATGDTVVARGRVLKAGRATTVAAADMLTVADGVETLCATALVTMRNLPPHR